MYVKIFEKFRQKLLKIDFLLLTKVPLFGNTNGHVLKGIGQKNSFVHFDLYPYVSSFQNGVKCFSIIKSFRSMSV